MDLAVRLAADGTLIVVLLVAVAVVVWKIRRDFWVYAPPIIMAGLTSLLTGKIMSLLYQPEVARPFLEVGRQAGASYIDNPGFPSDHVLLGVAAAVCVYAVTRNNRLVLLLGFLLVAMSVGRVLALVHTPLDIVGGLLAGLAGALWYKKLTK